jgi:predicted sugar kinase
VIEPPSAVLAAGTGTSFTLTKDDVPILLAPPGTRHFDVRVQARRVAGSATYDARTARAIRLFMPDGIKVAEVELWLGFGSDTRLTVDRAEAWVEIGTAERLTVTTADVFTERGGDSRLGVTHSKVYIEVLP